MSAQGTVEVNVAAIDEQKLCGDVGGLGREKEKSHGGNFFGLRHSFAKRYFRDDLLQLFFRVRQTAEPLFVERRHHLRRDDGVDANSVGE